MTSCKSAFQENGYLFIQNLVVFIEEEKIRVTKIDIIKKSTREICTFFNYFMYLYNSLS